MPGCVLKVIGGWVVVVVVVISFNPLLFKPTNEVFLFPAILVNQTCMPNSNFMGKCHDKSEGIPRTIYISLTEQLLLLYFFFIFLHDWPNNKQCVISIAITPCI